MAGSGVRLIIVSGPSGAGKSTVVRKLLDTCDLPIELSISATTRPPRPGEVDGRDYRFISLEEFQQLKEQNAFLECKEVFGQGCWYGTLRHPVEKALANGKWMLLEIDVQGALSVFPQFPDAIGFFVHPGSAEELEARLRGRSTDSEQSIARRLQVAADEMLFKEKYHYEIINREVDQSAREICQILHAQTTQEV